MVLFRFKDFVRVKADDNIPGKFELIFIKFFGDYKWFDKFNILIECFFIDFHEFFLFLSVEVIVDDFGEFVNFGAQFRVLLFFFKVGEFFICLFGYVNKEVAALRAVIFDNLECFGAFR